MGAIATIALIILGISFMTFVTFFGRLPALRHTPIAWLHRLIWVYFPNALYSVDLRLTSGKVTSSCSRFGNFIMHDKHPTVLIFFFLLLSIGEFMYLPTAWPQFTLFHKLCASVTIVCPYVFLYLAAFSDPGFIGPENHAHEMARYPYDHTLFHPGAVCQTCNFLKPARSKHCSICKRCISRLDHHCIFINSCVGVGNHHWFILLLLSTGILTLYGGVKGLGLMVAKMQARYPYWSLWFWRATTASGSGVKMPLKQWLIIWSWGLQDNVSMGSVTLLALLMTPLVWGLLGYHLWLIYCGTTTNESMKWSDWQAEMDDGFAFKRKVPADRLKDTRIEPSWTRWPAETEQILVRTENGKPPSPNLDLPGVGDWEPVWRLRDIENLYDLGFWDNLVDIFRPNYVFRDQYTPMIEVRGRKRRRKGRGRS
ncbi:zf-DHHC-domain-containing protein [Diplogelasinospora grovesii]|uniref:Palmitoyltransferase n=1 Tax=Diplogelasinospora grovesii TaxID=303347 RepID=A0AAN6NAI1_9PEZI|nr:zf-DHHC-domain-containing protein [Diplogelasinospora grovesii]